MSSEDLLRHSLLLFGRLLGFFLFSPLFSDKGLPKTVRLGAALSCTLLLAYPLSLKPTLSLNTPFSLTIDLMKEVVIGYFIGFIFSLLFEAAAFAGEVLGVVMGFSATELFDPLTYLNYPLIGRFFLLFAFAIFLCLDLHHATLRLIYESFAHFPSPAIFAHQNIAAVIKTSGQLFSYALDFAFYPLLGLLGLIALFAWASRFFSTFWAGFPLQLLLGLTLMAGAIYFFTPIIKEIFSQLFRFSLQIVQS